MAGTDANWPLRDSLLQISKKQVSHQSMRIGSGKEFVEITEIERVPQGVPDAGDVRVSVEVKLGEFGEFGGRYDSIWLEASALMCFVNELKVAENCRQGGASLQKHESGRVSFAHPIARCGRSFRCGSLTFAPPPQRPSESAPPQFQAVLKLIPTRFPQSSMPSKL